MQRVVDIPGSVCGRIPARTALRVTEPQDSTAQDAQPRLRSMG